MPTLPGYEGQQRGAVVRLLALGCHAVPQQEHAIRPLRDEFRLTGRARRGAVQQAFDFYPCLRRHLLVVFIPSTKTIKAALARSPNP